MSRWTAILCLCLTVGAAAPARADEEVARTAESLRSAPRGLEDLPPEVLEKLGPEQIAEILEMREDTEVAKAALGGPQGSVAIIVPLAFFLAILLGLAASLAFRYRKHAALQQTLRLMIEKGAAIPPELIAPRVSPHADLRRGLLLLGAGLALVLCIAVTLGVGDGSWTLGLIPAFIGVAYLIVWRLSRGAQSS